MLLDMKEGRMNVLQEHQQFHHKYSAVSNHHLNTFESSDMHSVPLMYQHVLPQQLDKYGYKSKNKKILKFKVFYN